MNTKHIQIKEEPIAKRIPSPSKYRKIDNRESEYESDYEIKIEPIWRPNTLDNQQPQYKPIKPVFTPTGRLSLISSDQSPIPSTEFEHPMRIEGSVRPKFEPIDKFKITSQYEQYSSSDKSHVLKPTPVSAKTINATPNLNRQSTQYYTATAGPAHHNRNAIANETCDQMQMQEHTESCHRMVNMMSSKRVIQFDQRQQSHHKESYDSLPHEVSQQTNQNTYTSRPKIAPPATPTKFVPGEIRESDYDSEVESIRIRPIWTPNPSDMDEPRYRRVSAPIKRPSSVVNSNDFSRRVLTPMEFDSISPQIPSKMYHSPSSSPQFCGNRDVSRTQTLDRYLYKKKANDFYRRTRDDLAVSQTLNTKKIEHDSIDYSSQIKQYQKVHNAPQQPIKPILKRAQSVTDQPQIYREENKTSQKGK